MNIIRVNDLLLVTLNDGRQLKTDHCTDEFLQDVMENMENEERLISLFCPDYDKKKHLVDGIAESKYITQRGNSLYIDSISPLSLPQDFAEAFVQAERSGEEDKITAYLNFWTLMSLNPDSRVRNNIFWFLQRWGMTISKSGLIVGYRNVDIKYEGKIYPSDLIAYVTREWAYTKYKAKKSPTNFAVMKDNTGEYYRTSMDSISIMDTYVGNLEDLYTKIITSHGDTSTVYTDVYTHTFEIKLGQVVSMERKQCDAEQEHDCSRGLHVGGKDWLSKNYFGEVGLRVLVNPADIVAVPTQSDYGKFRTCAYLPINVVEYDEDGHIKDADIDSGFEWDFLQQICYSGEVATNDDYHYSITIPDTPEFNREKIMDNLYELALSYGRK